MIMAKRILLLLLGATRAAGCVQVAADIAPHFILRPLPYPANALAPHISEETMLIHHGKHVKAYVDKANELTSKRPELHGKTLEELIASEDGPLFNQVGQIWNHNFFFESLRPPVATPTTGHAGGATGCSKNGECELQDAALVNNQLPAGAFRSALLTQFGSFEAFKDSFKKVAAAHFGSGWTWLVVERESGTLKVVDTDNGSNPLKENLGIALLGLDVWEHAYYIDYRNVRASYIDAFWNVVNWDHVAQNFVFAKEQLLES